MPLSTVGDLADIPVAVLTSDKTGSSGEVVAIAFAGRPGTRSFGEPTYGFATGNEIHPLRDGYTLLLTETWTANRSGTTYPDGVTPDSITDQPLEDATAWLREGCNQ
jgi:C-terminal processing protease CtpA/Prc